MGVLEAISQSGDKPGRLSCWELAGSQDIREGRPFDEFADEVRHETEQEISAVFEHRESATPYGVDPGVSFEGADLKPFCSLSCSLAKL
jgi:hypothetical protein